MAREKETKYGFIRDTYTQLRGGLLSSSIFQPVAIGIILVVIVVSSDGCKVVNDGVVQPQAD